MTKILLIRHAATDTAGKTLSGRTPGVLLNEEGYQQAEQLKQRLQHIPIDAIYSSPMERAMLTATPLSETRKLEIQTNAYFNEIDFGEWTNASIESLKNNDSFRLFNAFRSITRIPGGETMMEAQLRIVTGLGNLYGEFPGKTVVVVSHADMIKAALAFYLGMHLDVMHRIDITPCSVSMIHLFAASVTVTLMNHTGEI